MRDWSFHDSITQRQPSGQHKRIITECIYHYICAEVYSVHGSLTGCTRALGLHEYGILTVTILQAVISVSVDMLPLPGGMGISETLYMVMFVPVFGPLLLPSMLLSRGISYYGQMLISALMTCVAHLTIGRKNEEIQRM